MWHRKIGVLPPAVRRRSFRSGCVPASLRLRSTFPFVEPLAEAEWIQGRIKTQEVFVTVVDLARVGIEQCFYIPAKNTARLLLPDY